VPEGNAEGASILRERIVSKTRRRVPAVRIDDLVEELAFDPPFLVKADTQGSELEVLSGAERTLQSTDAVLLAVSLFQFCEGGPQMADVVAFMKNRGFLAYDIVGGHERPLDGALAQVDMVFVPETGPLRRESQYAPAHD